MRMKGLILPAVTVAFLATAAWSTVPAQAQVATPPAGSQMMKDMPMKDMPMKDMPMKDMPMKDMPMKDMPMKDMPMGDSPQGQVHQAGGTVKKLDEAKGTVTFAHGPVKSLNWPAMTMGFRVKDKALLERLDVGKEVEFEFVKEGSDYVVTGIR